MGDEPVRAGVEEAGERVRLHLPLPPETGRGRGSGRSEAALIKYALFSDGIHIIPPFPEMEFI